MGRNTFKTVCDSIESWGGYLITQPECMAILIEEFSRCDLTEFCIAPGSRNTPILLAGIRHQAPNFRVFHDERSMAFFALGIARRGKTIPVVVTTSGTAVANLLPAVIEADADGVPMILLTADRPASKLGKGANQTITQTNIFGAQAPTITIDEELTGYALLDLIFDIRQRLENKPGPVHINLPLQKPLLEVADLTKMSLNPAVQKWYESELPWKKINVAKRPFENLSDINDFDTVIVGANPMEQRASIENALREFRGETFFDIQSGSWCCGSRPLSAEVFSKTTGGGKVLILGHRFTEHRVWDWLSRFDYVEQWKTQSGIFDPNELVDRSFDITWLPADAASCEPKNILNNIAVGPLSYSKLVSVISSRLDRFKNIHLANSLTVRAFDRFRSTGGFSISSSLSFNRGASGIDGTLATGLGVAYNGESALVVCGDHAFLYDLSLLPDLHDSGIQATVLIVDNKGGRIFEHLPVSKNDALDKYFVAAPNAKLSAIISAFGFACEEVSSTSELDEVLQRKYEGVRFVIANVDPEFDLRDFSDRTEERFS